MSPSPDLIPGVIDSTIWSDDRWPGRNRPVVFVVHSPEAPETDMTAENVARYLASSPRTASVHFCTDNNSTVRTARDTDRVAGAGGANDIGLHVEIAGYAGQTRQQWLDAYSRAAMDRTARLFAEVAHKYWGIPPRTLTDAQLRSKTTPGIVTHAQCVRVFGGTHWDPGPHFPMEFFIGLCKGYTTRGNMMQFEDWYKQFNKAAPDAYDPVVEFIQWGLRKLTDREGNPFYGPTWRRDGRKGPVTEAAWTNFEKEYVGKPRYGDEVAGKRSYQIFLRRLGR